MRPSPQPARIIGRPDERRRIERFVDRLATAPGSLVIVGEAGIGKTTLWSYGLDLAATAGMRILLTRPAEDDWPVPGLGLRDFFDDDPVAADLLDDDLDPGTRARLFLDRIRTLAREAPVVLAVDDLQWLDGLTDRLVRHALRRLEGFPVAVLATARTWSPGELELPLRHATLAADVLRVEPMSVPDLHDLLADEGVQLTRPDLSRLHEVAGGNPLFAIKLSRLWHRGERAAVRATTLTLLADQVEALPDQARRVLELVALAGPAPLSIVSDGRSATDALELLSGPLAPMIEVDDHFVVRCAHPLIASAVHATLDPIRLQSLHARLAALVPDPVERARHLARSAADPDEVVAAELEWAAGAAIRRGSAATAAELAAHSVRLTPSALVDRAGPRALAELTYRAGAGQIGLAIELADRLLTTLNPGPLHTQVVSQRVLLDFAGGEAFLRQALAQVHRDEHLRGILLDLLGWQLGLFKGRLTESRTCCQEALTLARRTGDTGTIIRAAATLSTLSLLGGSPRPELMEEVVRAGEQGVRDQPAGTLLRVWPWVFHARQALWDGDLTPARAGFERTYQAAVALGSEFQRPYRLRDLAILELATGRLNLAHRYAVDGLEAAADAGNDQAVVWLAYPAGLVAALRGEREEAEWAADRLEAWSVRVDEPLRMATAEHVRGVLAGTLADWSTALAHHLTALRTLTERGYVHPGFISVLPQAIEAATLTGQLEVGTELVDRLEQQAGALDSPWVRAVLQLGRGQLGLLTGDLSRAESELDEAHARLATLGYGIDALRAEYFAGVAGLRAGHRVAARRRLEHARAGFAECGLTGWTVLAEDALQRVGGTAGSGLTRTEHTIVTKIGSGLRNKEIAAELFVSESTVEAHLTRIYRKLGIRGRSDLAGLAVSGELGEA